MITWHPTGAGGYRASVTVDGIAICTLHAHTDRWQIEDRVGFRGGPATSVPGAKRAALQALAAVLPKLQFAVETALRST